MGRLFKGCLIGCGAIVLITVLILFGTGMWAKQTFGKPKPANPKIGTAVALRPTFLVRGGQPYGAGTAVAVRVQPKSAPILLTAQHLFGPAGGMEPPIPPGDLNKKIKGVLLTPMAGGKPVAMAQGSLRKSGTFPDDGGDDVSGDVAAFKLSPKSRVNALDLAPANPAMGEWVWLVGDVFDHEPQTQRLFPGKVMIVSDKKTLIKFDDSFELRAFSGAPLINEKKQVVGLLIAGASGLGIINPVGSIRQRLQESNVR
jgi:hypothetical protein